MLDDAIKKATILLNDNSLHISSYAETKDYYLFSYLDSNGNPLFDNTMIKVDKKNKIATYFIITANLKEINELKFKKI